MGIATFGILLTVVAIGHGYVSVDVYRRAFRREGLPEKMIPHKELNQLAQRLDRAHSQKDVDLAEKEFNQAVAKTSRFRFRRLETTLRLINRVAYWVINFQTQLGRLINAFNLPLAASANLFYNIQSGYQREAIRYKGDFSKIHKALERSVLAEASKHLSRSDLRELERRISELDQREHRQIMLAYRVTRVD
ncbi:hypothetical protein Q1695_011570 [Nippostrongylus brasiliensis]|nr:hypothetical protein Q1695_011570 [Nippostrongylus brasiliensis]